MAYKTIIFNKKEGIARITFNRPDVMNAYSPEMSVELIQVVQELKNDRDTRVVVLTGAGDRAFMSGADIEKTICVWEKMAKSGGDVFEEKKKYNRIYDPFQ